MSIRCRVCLLVITFVAMSVLRADDDPVKPRNPFGVADLPEPDWDEVLKFADGVKLDGGDNDSNAEQWVQKAVSGQRGSIVGEWSERWCANGGAWHFGLGPTQIQADDVRVFMLLQSSNGKFLLELKRKKDLLYGRYQCLDRPGDAGVCVFRIVTDERIDGNWSGRGRWDFRRRLK